MWLKNILERFLPSAKKPKNRIFFPFPCCGMRSGDDCVGWAHEKVPILLFQGQTTYFLVVSELCF